MGKKQRRGQSNGPCRQAGQTGERDSATVDASQVVWVTKKRFISVYRKVYDAQTIITTLIYFKFNRF